MLSAHASSRSLKTTLVTGKTRFVTTVEAEVEVRLKSGNRGLQLGLAVRAWVTVPVAENVAPSSWATCLRPRAGHVRVAIMGG